MQTYEIVFSPTGGTAKAARVVAGALSEERIFLDLSDLRWDPAAVTFAPEDVCVVAVPSYGGRVPAIAVTRLRQLRGGGAKAVLMAVYGNRAYEDTLLELQDTLIQAGFCCVAAIAALAEHSIMHQFAAGRPDAEDEQTLAAFAARIRRKLEAGAAPAPLALPGNRPYREYGGVPMKPKAGKACTQCGLCAQRCPVGAIPPGNPTATMADVCISCMRCVAICPSGARSVNKVLVAAGAMKMKKACEGRKENELYL